MESLLTRPILEQARWVKEEAGGLRAAAKAKAAKEVKRDEIKKNKNKPVVVAVPLSSATSSLVFEEVHCRLIFPIFLSVLDVMTFLQ